LSALAETLQSREDRGAPRPEALEPLLETVSRAFDSVAQATGEEPSSLEQPETRLPEDAELAPPLESLLSHLRLATGAAAALHGGGEAAPSQLRIEFPVRRSILSALSFRSLDLRHAVRVGLTAAAAALLGLLLHRARRYWIIVTAVLVLQPHSGATLRKGLQRIAGTMAGAIAASLLAPSVHGHLQTAALLFVRALPRRDSRRRGSRSADGRPIAIAPAGRGDRGAQSARPLSAGTFRRGAADRPGARTDGRGRRKTPDTAAFAPASSRRRAAGPARRGDPFGPRSTGGTFRTADTLDPHAAARSSRLAHPRGDRRPRPRRRSRPLRAHPPPPQRAHLPHRPLHPPRRGRGRRRDAAGLRRRLRPSGRFRRPRAVFHLAAADRGPRGAGAQAAAASRRRADDQHARSDSER